MNQRSDYGGVILDTECIWNSFIKNGYLYSEPSQWWWKKQGCSTLLLPFFHLLNPHISWPVLCIPHSGSCLPVVPALKTLSSFAFWTIFVVLPGHHSKKWYEPQYNLYSLSPDNSQSLCFNKIPSTKLCLSFLYFQLWPLSWSLAWRPPWSLIWNLSTVVL